MYVFTDGEETGDNRDLVLQKDVGNNVKGAYKQRVGA